MKNYVRPSLEINKFAVEDIICASGVIGGYSDMRASAQAVYDQYATQAGLTQDQINNATIVEFEW